MRVTQKDIARTLNLSQSLVAGILANKSGVWASPENRERIQRAALEMGYRPNIAARRLRTGKSHSVGFVVLHSPNGSDTRRLPLDYGGIVEALTQYLDPLGYELILKTFTEPEQARESLAEMAQADACDVFVLCGPSSEADKQAAQLEAFKRPFVVLGSLEEARPLWPQIDFDHLGMMRQSVAYLASLGHRNLVYLGHANTEQYAQRLEAGFSAAMQGYLGKAPLVDDFARSEKERDLRTEEQMLNWLARPTETRPTAVVVGASDDATWRGLELGLARAGRRLGDKPGDFAATGLHHTDQPLLFGTALGFSQTDLGHLTEILCKALLQPLLVNEIPADPILRVCPPMLPMPSLRLLEYVRFL